MHGLKAVSCSVYESGSRVLSIECHIKVEIGATVGPAAINASSKTILK